MKAKVDKASSTKMASGAREQVVFLDLQRAAEAMKAPFIDLFKRYELTMVQFNVLRILRGAGSDGLACGEVSQRMINRDSDITRMHDRLEARGLIRRERQSADRRVVLSFITEKGLELLAELDTQVLEMHRQQLEHMTKQELKQLRTLVRRASGMDT